MTDRSDHHRTFIPNGKTNRPLKEGGTERGGVNPNPSASLSRPAPPQPYKPALTGYSGSASKK